MPPEVIPPETAPVDVDSKGFAPNGFDPKGMERPAPQLFTYYILGALASGPFIFVFLPILWFRYQTLRYQFEDSGLRMQVGLLFRKETITAYRRIQDIHLTSNVIQRWLGIASISIQTASGSATPEIIIEGVSEPEKLRDWLYARLRGARSGTSFVTPASSQLAAIEEASNHSDPSEVTRLLTDIRDNLAAMANRDRRGDS
jgi:uncharacterized protein